MAENSAESGARTPYNSTQYGASSASRRDAEKNASGSSAPAATAAGPPKLRSCVTCRSRKVRCNKESPCSNCRRAGIPCVVPSADRPPRWARRFERAAYHAATNATTAGETHAQPSLDAPTAQVMERLRNLEAVVKDLSRQLEQAHAVASSSTGNSPASSTHDHTGDPHQTPSPATGTGTSSIQSHFGRLVLNDASRSRYVSSGFWSRVNDELDEIKTETRHLADADLDSSEDEELSGTSPSTQELGRPASKRHAFLFRHNLSAPGPDLRELHPLPSQIPFLLDVFSENVNLVIQIVHMPTVNKIARRSVGSDITPLTPANEALMFSIYYAAVTSMEDEDVWNNFGSTKADLNLKYRLGLEHALARADFMNVPDIVLVQAFAIFLLLVRRHDSPRFVWMMTGLVIRMGQALGLQRDGTHFQNLTPFDVEIRRRVWYALCSLDVRASEDQGTDFTIQHGSFDTKLPLNIDDDDIHPDTQETPTECEGITDMTLPIVSMKISIISRQMLVPGIGLDEQNRLLSTIFPTLEELYLRFLPSSENTENIRCWVMIVVAHLVVGKLTLFTHMPVLFSAPGEHFSDEVRNKLLVAAIEVAEFNHALNTEKACRQWRWVYQTYTHWHAIVYLLLDICRRPWSPLVDRAWVALHSPWLIPASSKLDKGLRTWVPLQKLIQKARKHRDDELKRLRHDASGARRLEAEDRKLPIPSTVGSVSASAVANNFRERWRRLVGISEMPAGSVQTDDQHTLPILAAPQNPAQLYAKPAYSSSKNEDRNSASSQPINAPINNISINEPSIPPTAYTTMDLDQPFYLEPQANIFSEPADNSYGNRPVANGGLFDWFWADTESGADAFTTTDLDATDLNVDMDGGIDWHNWVESAKCMEMDAHMTANQPNS